VVDDGEVVNRLAVPLGVDVGVLPHLKSGVPSPVVIRLWARK
jgi:hypothetical protein